jgi:hypothetical protein
MKDVSIEVLAKKIARDIFETGDDPNSPTNRIEFKGEKDLQGNERAQGGLCFVACNR